MSNMDTDGVVRGSGDFLKDMGYANPGEMRVKFALANAIALAIEDRGLDMPTAARIAGLSIHDNERITNGIVKEYAVDHLTGILAAVRRSEDPRR